MGPAGVAIGVFVPQAVLRSFYLHFLFSLYWFVSWSLCPPWNEVGGAVSGFFFGEKLWLEPAAVLLQENIYDATEIWRLARRTRRFR